MIRAYTWERISSLWRIKTTATPISHMLRSIVTLVTIGLIASSSLRGGTIVLSGDVNIIDPLSKSINPGNQQFFKNVAGDGSSVLVDAGADFFEDLFGTRLTSFYSGVPGLTTSRNTVNPLSDSLLSGIDLLAIILPSSGYGVSEIAAISNFLGTGGTIFFLGDQRLFPTQNTNINNALSALGSSMSIVPGVNIDAGDPLFDVTGAGQITANSLTAGVNSLSYSVPSKLQVVGGTSLVRGSNGNSFIAVESIVAQVPDAGGTLSLLGFGFAVLAFLRRRLAS